VPVQVIAWRTIFEMTGNVSSGTLSLLSTHPLTHSHPRASVTKPYNLVPA